MSNEPPDRDHHHPPDVARLVRFAEPLAERLEVSKVSATKGNGPDAANIRPAKKYDFNAADFRTGASRIPAFFSLVSINLHVADVADVAALIHKGFLLQRHDFSDVADVAAWGGQPTIRHRHHAAARCWDRIRFDAQKHHGLGGPERGATSAPFIGQRIFFFLPHVALGHMASFMTGRVGASARVRWSSSSPPTPHGLSPLLGGKGAVLTLSRGANMADIRTHAPATGTLGNSPAISPNILPRWAYLALALACVVMGLWASYITLQYFEHGAKALEADTALQALAVSAAVMFVASEMGAFALAALLTERQLRARRWGLTAFAAAVLLLEVFTIVAVQLALTVGASMTQTSVSDTATDLQKQIATVEANAKTYAATAESLRAADQLKKAAAQTDKATAEQAKASQLYDRLALARTQRRPTLTGLLGEKTAIAYAVARGVLVSLGGLVFFGVAGALLRAARGGVLSVDQQILQLLHELRGAPGTPVAPAQSVAPAAQAPALASFKPVGTVAPTSAPVGFSYGSKMSLAGAAGAGLLAATAAPVAHSAPAVPAAVSKPVHAGVAESVHAQSANTGSSDASNVAPAMLETSAAGVAESVHAGVSESIQQIIKTPRAKRAVSAKIDTGVEGKAGARFKRIKAGVTTGKIRPSVRGIQAVEGGSQEVVADYLKQLEADGVITRKGRGWALVKSGGAA